jgi:hypothetical protein
MEFIIKKEISRMRESTFDTLNIWWWGQKFCTKNHARMARGFFVESDCLVSAERISPGCGRSRSVSAAGVSWCAAT